MRKSLKKLLSFVLVIGIMAGSFIFAMPALADSGVVLETNGGTLASTAPIEAGALLPNYEGITREGCTFGGWFLNADLSGAQQFTAEANKTYYARWVIHDVTVTNFEGWDDSTFASNVRVYNEYHTNKSAYAQLNTNSANAYSGSNSAKIYVSWDANSSGAVIDFGDNDTTGRWYNDDNIKDGVCFWMTTDHAVTFKIQWWNNYVCTVSVAAGKHIITIPNVTGYNYNFKLVFQKPNGPRPTVYIDDFGSFTDVPYIPPVVEVPAAYETNGGTFNAGYTIPTAAGETLPTYKNITREGCVFGGWYTEADFSGNQKFVIENNTKYYARWISVDLVTDFEEYTPETFISQEGNASNTFHFWDHKNFWNKAFFNTDSANALSGNNSAVIKLAADSTSDELIEFGDNGNNKWWASDDEVDAGFTFWIKTNNTINLKMEISWWRYSETYTIPAGEHIITIPKLAGVNESSRFNIYGPSVDGTVVYVDNIGSFTDIPYIAPTPVTLNTNGGTLADPDAEYYALDTLPTEITKANAIFIGWYDNAGFTGTPVTVAQSNGVYYAKWVDNYKAIDNFEGYTESADHWFELAYGSATAVDTISLNTDATTGNKSLKVITNNIKSAGGDAQWGVVGVNLGADASFTSEGLYFYVKSNYELSIRVIINGMSVNNKLWGVNDCYELVNIAIGENHIYIPWTTFGSGVNPDTVTSLGFAIKGRWSNDGTSKGECYIDNLGMYGAKVKPSYGIATPGAAGLFSAVQSENSGIVITPGHAVYEVGGTKYTAFRVFGTYTAPDKNGAPDFGKVVVGEGDVRDIVSRHVMLGYKKAPTLEDNYVMTNAKGDFDKCWSYEQNPDGSWKVTYSLLLKDIPEDYAATAFNVKSAIVTEKGIIESGEMVEGVSAQAIFDKIEGDKPVWFN